MDRVARVGPQLWSWTDSESALRTVSAWVFLFCELSLGKVSLDPENADLEPDRDSWIEFAQTIVAGLPLSERPHLDDLTRLVDWLRVFLREPDDVDQRVKRGQFQTDVSDADIIPFQHHIQRATEGRVFFTTRRGLMGLGPASTEPDDTINVLPSGKSYYVLRPTKLKNAQQKVCLEAADVSTMELVGDCYWNDEQWRRGSQHGGTDRYDRSQDDSQPQGSLPYGLLAPFLREAGLDDFGREMIALI